MRYIALKLAFVVVAVAAATSCSTQPAVIGKWRQSDKTLEFRKDRTFYHVLGTGPINVQHQEWSGNYRFTAPDELKLIDIYFDHTTNGLEHGPLIWKVSIGGDELTTTRPGGSQEKWQRARN
jgi:hypothetical protein